MGKLLLLVVAVGFAVYACNVHEGRHKAAMAPEDGLRSACKQFIERQQLEASNANWGEYWAWTITGGADGEYAVGARYAVAGRTRYTVCTLQREGSSIRLVRLTRVQ